MESDDNTTTIFSKILHKTVLAVTVEELGDKEVETLLERVTSWNLEALTTHMTAKFIFWCDKSEGHELLECDKKSINLNFIWEPNYTFIIEF